MSNQNQQLTPQQYAMEALKTLVTVQNEELSRDDAYLPNVAIKQLRELLYKCINPVDSVEQFSKDPGVSLLIDRFVEYVTLIPEIIINVEVKNTVNQPVTDEKSLFKVGRLISRLKSTQLRFLGDFELTQFKDSFKVNKEKDRLEYLFFLENWLNKHVTQFCETYSEVNPYITTLLKTISDYYSNLNMYLLGKGDEKSKEILSQFTLSGVITRGMLSDTLQDFYEETINAPDLQGEFVDIDFSKVNDQIDESSLNENE